VSGTDVASPPLSIANESLPNGKVGEDYAQDLLVAGGNGDRAATFTTSAGTLPAGLTFDQVVSGGKDRSTRLVGKPTNPGKFTFTLKAEQGNKAASKEFSVTISGVGAAIAVTTSNLPLGQVGTAYAATLESSGGTPAARTWTVASGKLPTGLLLNAASGVISGTPSVDGTSNFTAKVSQGSSSASKALSISVAPGGLAPTKAAILNLNEKAQAIDLFIDGTRAARGLTVPASRNNHPKPNNRERHQTPATK